MKKRTLLTTLRHFLVGFSMGAADLVPGVSGGTIAFVSGIYEQLLAAITTVTGPVLRLVLRGKLVQAFKLAPLKFVVPLGVGMMLAILSLSHLIEYLLEVHPIPTWSLFFGLVVSSIILVGRTIAGWSWRELLSISIGIVVTYWLVGAVPLETPATPLAFFFSGIVAICAMILPGISGSFILVLLGKYPQVLHAVSDREFMTLIYVALGAVVGLSIFSRLLKYLLSTYHSVTLAVLLGVLIGSLRKIWPWKMHSGANFFPDLNAEFLIALVCAVAGAFLVLGISQLERGKRTIVTDVTE